MRWKKSVKAKKGGGDGRVPGHCRVFIEPWKPTNLRMVELDLHIPFYGLGGMFCCCPYSKFLVPGLTATLLDFSSTCEHSLWFPLHYYPFFLGGQIWSVEQKTIQLSVASPPSIACNLMTVLLVGTQHGIYHMASVTNIDYILKLSQHYSMRKMSLSHWRLSASRKIFLALLDVDPGEKISLVASH